MKLIECVPNFSEGRDQGKIDQIVAAIQSTGASILDVDPGAATNRTVVTIVGTPEVVIEGAYQGIKKASEMIDMRHHRGEHPRMGATDVCPFIPISGVTEAEAIEFANSLAERVGRELLIPVYLYEKAAKTKQRQNLAVVRSGEYEGFFKKIKDPQWTPDFGPSEFNEIAGGTVIGVREFLIAYNINLNTKSTLIARKIANRLREKGYPSRDQKGDLIKKDGKKVLTPGLFKDVKAVGWYIEEYQRAQISINLTNYKISSIHEVFDAACDLATQFGARVTGSELVGLIPRDAIVAAGLHFIQKSGLSHGISESDIVETAIQSLGLRELTPFDPREKIIEYRVASPRPLAQMSIKFFVNQLASNAPAPGGGSVAALAGALAGALTAMVANLTVGKRGYRSVTEEMKAIAYEAQLIKQRCLDAIDDDTAAFNRLMDAFGLPKGDHRNEAIEVATKEATLIPFKVLQEIPGVIELAFIVGKKGNKNAFSDAGVAALMAKSGAYGAYYNVLINLKEIKDEAFKTRLKADGALLVKQIDKLATEIETMMFEGLE